MTEPLGKPISALKPARQPTSIERGEHSTKRTWDLDRDGQTDVQATEHRAHANGGSSMHVTVYDRDAFSRDTYSAAGPNSKINSHTREIWDGGVGKIRSRWDFNGDGQADGAAGITKRNPAGPWWTRTRF